jgi:hypothetical protein
MVQRRRTLKIRETQQKLRSRLWPKLDESKLWHREKKHGFITIPRPMPLIMKIMDDLAGGQPVSTAYLELWCRSFDESFVTLSNPGNIAFSWASPDNEGFRPGGSVSEACKRWDSST